VVWAVVIVGALFKILHWPGATEMLIVGLLTEAGIFAISSFDPLPPDEHHYDWTKVYPILDEEKWRADETNPLVSEDGVPATIIGSTGGAGGGMAVLGPKIENTDELKKAAALFTPSLFVDLSKSVKGLKDGVEQLSEASDISAATTEFGTKVKAASTKVEALNQTYTQNADVMKQSADIMKQFNTSMNAVKGYQEQMQSDVKNYQESLKKVSTNLSALNNVYELELKDAQNHVSSISKFYGSISSAMQNLLETSKGTEQLRQEVSSLAKNMNTLNTVYGNMLTAMRTNAS